MPDSDEHRPALARQAMLKPEFAHLYPWITPGTWRVAAVLADVIVARHLERGDKRFISRDKVLPEEHFFFRYGSPPLGGGEGQRASDNPQRE